VSVCPRLSPKEFKAVTYQNAPKVYEEDIFVVVLPVTRACVQFEQRNKQINEQRKKRKVGLVNFRIEEFTFEVV
jgi:hypothetical protein